MDNSKILSFLADEEKRAEFENNYFERKIRLENSGEEENISDFLTGARNYSIDLYKNLILDNNSSFAGLWIKAKDGDGVSWVSEKILKFFQDNIDRGRYADVGVPQINILKKDDDITSEKLPEISNLIGEEKFINFIKSVENTSVKTIRKLMPVGISVLPFIWTLWQASIKNEVSYIGIFSFLFLILIYFGVVIYDYICDNSKSKNKKEDAIESINELSKNELLYKKLVKLLANKISVLKSPRIIIADDFSALDELSKNVLKECYESKKNNFEDKDLWIIFTTKFVNTSLWKNKDKKIELQTASLIALTGNEKKDLISKFGFYKGDSDFNVMKKICCKSPSPDLIKELKEKLENLKSDKDSEEVFRFLYLVASNAFPEETECSRDALITKIRDTNKVRERKKYIPEIWNNKIAPDETTLKHYFTLIDGFLKKCDNGNFRVKRDVLFCIESEIKEPGLPNKLYHYSNGYWAICWYFVIREKQDFVNWIPKLAHHLKEASVIKDEDLYRNMFDAHLFVIEKSIKYFLWEETNDIIESALSLNIQEQDNSAEQLQRLVKDIAFVLLNFEVTNEKDKINRKKLEKIGYERFYDFIEKDDISPVDELLEKYEFLADEIIYVLIERYWEKVLFLYISDEYEMRNSLAEAAELKLIIEKYLTNDYLQSNTDDMRQKIQNISIWIFIHFWNNNVKDVLSLIKSFIEYGNEDKVKNYHKNIEHTLLYMTIQECAYIIISSIMVVNKNAKNELSEELEKCKLEIISLYDLEDDIDFEGITKLMQLQSLMWQQSNYTNRSYILNSIKILLWNIYYADEYINDDYIKTQRNIFKYELKDVLPDHRLNTVVSFTLCYLEERYDMEKSSYYFHKAYSHKKTPKNQLEYLFICLVKKWHCENDFVKDVMCSFVRYGNDNNSDILPYISNNIEANYLHITNTLNSFEREKLLDSMVFFREILELIKKQKILNCEKIYDIIAAEATLKNFEFAKMSEAEKFKSKKEYEDFWIGKEDLQFYSKALDNLFKLEQTDELKEKIYVFLIQIQENSKYNENSRHLLLACNYLRACKKNNDNKYQEILGIVIEKESDWIFKKEPLYMEEVYSTLIFCTGEQKYKDALLEIKLNKISNNDMNVSDKDFCNFLCNLCLNENYIYNDNLTEKGNLDIVKNIIIERNPRHTEQILQMLKKRKEQIIYD